MTQPSNMQVSADDGGTLYTNKLNEILSAHTTGFAGPSEPTNPVPFMFWQDTSVEPPREYRRNSTNTGWDDLGRRGTATFYGNVTGSAASCNTLTTPRAIAISGAGTGSASFDGSANATINLTLANSGVTAGTYGSATHIPIPVVNSKGIITGISQVAMSKAGLVESFNGRSGTVSLTTADVFNVLPSKAGNKGKSLALNSAETGLEWIGPMAGSWTLLATTSIANNGTVDLKATYGKGTYFIHNSTSGQGKMLIVTDDPTGVIFPQYWDVSTTGDPDNISSLPYIARTGLSNSAGTSSVSIYKM